MSKISGVFSNTIAKLKVASRKELAAGNIETAQRTIRTCADLLYNANFCYADDTLEEMISQIADTLPPVQAHPVQTEKRTILFYDGFGINNRGLIQIYLNALAGLGDLVYVVHERCREQIPDVLHILSQCDSRVIWLSGESCCTIMEQIHTAFSDVNPTHAFLYTLPDDVPALAAFEHNKSSCVVRYQINLTDHAFWLGRNAFDYCIEFRDYGASISKDYRKIPEQKLVKLPFYPAIDRSKTFEGFPFEVSPENKVVFSGGALYKTLGAENRYYQMAEYILQQFPEAIFWYAGSGDATQMNKLIAKYPGRAYLTAERQDLYQVLEHCFFYLSTYPVCGGLMFQYAASAGKIPVTLHYDSISDDFLLNQKDLGIEFDSLDAVKQEINKLFTNHEYRTIKEALVKKSVATKEDFEEHLKRLLTAGTTDYPITYKSVDTACFRGEYEKNLKRVTIYKAIGRLGMRHLFRHMPATYLHGLFLNIYQKLHRS